MSDPGEHSSEYQRLTNLPAEYDPAALAAEERRDAARLERMLATAATRKNLQARLEEAFPGKEVAVKEMPQEQGYMRGFRPDDPAFEVQLNVSKEEAAERLGGNVTGIVHQAGVPEPVDKPQLSGGSQNAYIQGHADVILAALAPGRNPVNDTEPQRAGGRETPVLG